MNAKNYFNYNTVLMPNALTNVYKFNLIVNLLCKYC